MTEVPQDIVRGVGGAISTLSDTMLGALLIVSVAINLYLGYKFFRYLMREISFYRNSNGGSDK